MTMVHKGNLKFKTIRDVQNCCKKEQEGIGNLLFR